MRLREFIGLVGGTAAAWPLAVYAQPRQEAARSGCAVLRIDLERDPVASGFSVAVVSEPS